MKFPGIIEAGTKSGVLTEAKYVKGSYIVFSTVSERDKFSGYNCNGVLVNGTPCYVAATGLEYRWNGKTWSEGTQASIPSFPTGSKIYGIQNGQWVEITVDEATKETIATLTTQVGDLTTQIEDIHTNINSLQQQFTELDEQVVKYTILPPTTTTNSSSTKQLRTSSIDWSEPTTPSLTTPEIVIEESRKTIQLKNSDLISSFGSGELSEQTFNLATISQQNTAEFGSEGVHLNLNTKDSVTVNGTHTLLTDQDKESIENSVVEATKGFIKFELVETLPGVGELNTLYLISNNDSSYSGHIYINGAWGRLN